MGKGDWKKGSVSIGAVSWNIQQPIQAYAAEALENAKVRNLRTTQCFTIPLRSLRSQFYFKSL